MVYFVGTIKSFCSIFLPIDIINYKFFYKYPNFQMKLQTHFMYAVEMSVKQKIKQK